MAGISKGDKDMKVNRELMQYRREIQAYYWQNWKDVNFAWARKIPAVLKKC
jgi:hypothetical protein